MKKQRLLLRTIILVLLASAVGYTVYANFKKDDIQVLAVGDQAPDFVLTDLNGQRHRLSEYKGQGVFLNFWATWCKPCEKEMPYIKNQYQEYKDKGVQVLAVDIGESELAVKKFVERKQLDFPILIDKDTSVQTAYGVNPLPVTYLIDKEGKLVKIHTGPMTEATVKEYMELIKP